MVDNDADEVLRLQDLNLTSDDPRTANGPHAAGNDPGVDNEQLKRALAATAERVKLVMQSMMSLGERQESMGSECKERQTYAKELAKLLEGLDRSVIALQDRVSVQEAQIARLNIRLDELAHRSNDGQLIWKIADYRRRKEDAIGAGPVSFYSEDFHTSRFGYKVCARVYLNGDGVGRGTHLSLFCAIRKGEYDPFLKWPFQQSVTFRMLNQRGRPHVEDLFHPDAASGSFARPVKDMNVASGSPRFISHERLESADNGFLKDDALYIQVVVDTSNL